MQILLLQTFSTCFGRHAPIIRSIKYWHETTVSSLIWRSEDPPATISTCTGGCRVSILYSWWWAHDARNMLRKFAVIKSASCCITSVFYLTLYYDTRKHKIKKKYNKANDVRSLTLCSAHSTPGPFGKTTVPMAAMRHLVLPQQLNFVRHLKYSCRGIKLGRSHWGRNVGWGVWREGVEENIWAQEGRDDRGVEKTT